MGIGCSCCAPAPPAEMLDRRRSAGHGGCLCEAPYPWSDRRSLYPLDAGDVQLLAFALGSAGGEANGEVP